LAPGLFGQPPTQGTGSLTETNKRASSTPADTSTSLKKTCKTGRRLHVIFDDKDDKEDFVERCKDARNMQIDKLLEYNDNFSSTFIVLETQRAIDIITGNR
jgi:TusA-related sulfurtransferase